MGQGLNGTAIKKLRFFLFLRLPLPIFVVSDAAERVQYPRPVPKPVTGHLYRDNIFNTKSKRNRVYVKMSFDAYEQTLTFKSLRYRVKQNYLTGSYPLLPNLTQNPLLKQLERRLF